MAQVNAENRSASEIFDPFAPGFLADPYPHYRRLREHARIFFHPQLNAWLISGYREFEELLRATEPGRGEEMRFFGNFAEGSSIDRVSADWIFYMDPPDHTRLRRCFATAFTPRRVESLRGFTESLVYGLLDDLGSGGEFNRIVADKVPVKVICRLLGVPEECHDEAKVRSTAMVPLLDPLITPDQLTLAEDAAKWFLELFTGLVDQKAKAPGDDLISALLATAIDGQGLTREEIAGNVIFLFAAGHETTTSTIGNTLVALLRHPDQREQLVADRALVADAIVEAIRWDAPVQYIGRMVKRDFDYGGIEFTAGQRLMGMIGAANRDPMQFDDPDEFRIKRNDGKSMAFGSGIHFCMGAALARMEAEVAVGGLLARYPNIQFASDPVQGERFAMRSYAQLEVRTK